MHHALIGVFLKLKNKTAGPDWFDLPAPNEADLPRLYREVEALRLRNQLDPKRFYRKDDGEGKGIKGLPQYFAVRLSPFFLFPIFQFKFWLGTDWHRYSVNYTIWHCQRGQSAKGGSEEDTRG
jgi:hypothetical protein